MHLELICRNPLTVGQFQPYVLRLRRIIKSHAPTNVIQATRGAVYLFSATKPTGE
ncbi:MAG: hypothetical protein KKF08_09590 [Gammaproteobacteria bacterium]|nr:hypothetical protein [Gammaproteobacteria bacterium]